MLAVLLSWARRSAIIITENDPDSCLLMLIAPEALAILSVLIPSNDRFVSAVNVMPIPKLRIYRVNKIYQCGVSELREELRYK